MLYEINYKSDNSRLLDKKNSTKVCELDHTNNDTYKDAKLWYT